MARFDRKDKKNIVDFFETLGYSVVFFNADDESGEWRPVTNRYGSTYNNKFYNSPITIVGNKNGDTWNVYNTDEARTWSSELAETFIVDEKGNLTFAGNPTRWVLEFVKGGSKILRSSLDAQELDAEEYSTSNEFANFENFDSIDAPDYSVVYGDDPQVSVASPIVNVEELTASQIKKAEEKLLESKNALAELLEAKKKGDLSSAMWTFDEIDELYNSKISADDKRAFFIYLQNKNKKKLSGDWDAKYGSSYPAEATTILELMKKGALFYDPTAKLGERLQPKVIYKSGNLWRKWTSLSSKKDEYIKRFGEQIYNLHQDFLKPAYEDMYDKRLLVRGDKDIRLHLAPISSLAQDIKIDKYVNPADRSKIENNHRIYTSFVKGELKQDLIRTSGDPKNFIDKKTLSLYEAFILWCKSAGRGNQAQTNGIQWSSITTSVDELVDYYLKPKTNPFSKEKNKDEKWARYKDDARKVGERLFAQFLAEGLEPDDQVIVETIWNSVYNAYVEPVLDEVPIGFTFKKYFLDISLFVLRDSNLRSIRYYLTRGSIGLAYGVGLGKTFCSIFAMKQALDLGIAKRPLVIVPNQVYFQFANEIKNGLGSSFDATKENSRLNMFANGSGVVNNSLGNNAVDGINLCTYEATEAFQFQKENLQMSWVEKAVSIVEMGGEISNEPIIENFIQKNNVSLFNEQSIGDDEDQSDEYEIEDDVIEETQDEDEDFDLGDTFADGGGVGIKPKKPKKPVEPIVINQESTNYDMIVVDEAHNFNNLFSAVYSEPKSVQKAEKNDKGVITIQREKNPYSSIRETSGGKDGSARAKKLWFLVRFVQHYNPMGNTILLSATPFTNSPIQLYSMLSFLNYEMLYNDDLGIIKDFFDTFSKIEYSEDFKTDLTIVKRNKFVGWVNLISLQKYVYRVFDKSSREEEDKAVVRPNKWVLPLKRQMVDGKLIEFAKENYVSTTIRMSDLQLELWNNVRAYAQGKLRYEDLFGEAQRNTTYLGKYIEKKASKKKTESAEGDSEEVDIVDGDTLADGTREGEKAKDTAKALQCLMWGRQIALNPYLFKGSGFKQNPKGKDYVEQSPKILYVMECIRTIKQYYEANPELGYWDYSDDDNPIWVNGMSGQVIYMNFGTKAFELIRDYLVSELGFAMEEIGIIRGNGNYIGKKRFDKKQVVQDTFLGRAIDPETGKYKAIPSEKRVKVLIGSESIKEGINLQDYASVLYNCFLDFNPTDQVQVEGRIWRQGNALANVRIVTPLVADCIDVFMFQKLEDKTERINQIWTKNGNLNELDTTAFNPSELKYELLTDPVAIALLEREYKFDQLEEQRVLEGEILSGYLSLQSIYKKSMELKFKPLANNVSRDFYFSMYYQINQIRPDLIDKKLSNDEFYLKTLAPKIFEEGLQRWNFLNINSYEDFLRTYPTLYSLSSKAYEVLDNNSQYNLWSANYSNPLWRMNLEKSLNYSAEDLINLMVQVLKEQKIAYPRGYSKNWRELIPKKERPIVDGDIVEFDTKKGRKKGTSEVVTNDNGSEVLESFYYHLLYQFKNNDADKKAINEAIQRLKLSNLFDIETGKNTTYDLFDKNKKSEIATLLIDFYENNPNSIISNSSGDFIGIVQPKSLDIGDIEDINIEEKNVVRVKKAGEGGQKVEPTKYPEPFTWGNKERNNNLKDIAEYLGVIVRPKYGDTNYNRDAKLFIDANLEEQIPQFNDEIQCLIQILLPSSSSIDALKLKTFDPTYLPNTWAELVDSWKDTYYNGLFKIYSRQFYSTDLPMTLTDFKREEETKLKPMGINNFQDVENLILEQKTKINTISLEQKQLYDEQRMQEMVEEVIRTQQELNSEEIRLGSSFKSRANLFATPNSDYLGNEMLSIFKKSEKDQTEKIEAKVETIIEAKVSEPIIEVEEVEEIKPIMEEIEEVVIPKTSQELIDILEEGLPFETPREQKKTRKLIEDLREAMMFD